MGFQSQGQRQCHRSLKLGKLLPRQSFNFLTLFPHRSAEITNRERALGQPVHYAGTLRGPSREEAAASDLSTTAPSPGRLEERSLLHGLQPTSHPPPHAQREVVYLN